MSALALPQKLVVSKANEAICKRLGVKIDGNVMPDNVVAYDVAAGTARLLDGSTVRGTIEPYWKARR